MAALNLTVSELISKLTNIQDKNRELIVTDSPLHTDEVIIELFISNKNINLFIVASE